MPAYVSYKFKRDLLLGKHDFSKNDYYLALFTSAASTWLSAGTEFYQTTAEISGVNYTTGGKIVSAQVVLASSVAYVDLPEIIWTSAVTNSPRYAVLYQTSSNRIVAYWDIGYDVILNDKTFIFKPPTPGIDTALIRVL